MPTTTPLYKAIAFMVFSAIAFSIMNSIIRYVDHLPTFELVFFRSIGSVICTFLFLQTFNIPKWGSNKKLLLTRAVVGFIAMSLFYKALQLMPMGSAVSLRYLSPFFAAALAIILLGEKVKPLQWLFFGTAFIGVVILKGFDARISMIGLAVILTSAFFSGMVYVVIRKIGQSEHPVVVVHYFMLLSSICAGLMSMLTWQNPQGIEWLLLSCLGILGFVAQYFMTKAMQAAEANLITPFKYAEVVFTILIGWAYFGENQTWIALLGMLIIVASLLANVWVKQRLKINVRN